MTPMWSQSGERSGRVVVARKFRLNVRLVGRGALPSIPLLGKQVSH